MGRRSPSVVVRFIRSPFPEWEHHCKPTLTLPPISKPNDLVTIGALLGNDFSVGFLSAAKLHAELHLRGSVKDVVATLGRLLPMSFFPLPLTRLDDAKQKLVFAAVSSQLYQHVLKGDLSTEALFPPPPDVQKDFVGPLEFLAMRPVVDFRALRPVDFEPIELPDEIDRCDKRTLMVQRPMTPFVS